MCISEYKNYRIYQAATLFTLPKLRRSEGVPFEMSLMLPAPRYARVILERDRLGRIVYSRPVDI